MQIIRAVPTLISAPNLHNAILTSCPGIDSQRHRYRYVVLPSAQRGVGDCPEHDLSPLSKEEPTSSMSSMCGLH